MNFTVVKTNRIKQCNRPVHLESLERLLTRVGVRKVRCPKNGAYRHLPRSYPTEAQLYERYEAARESYRQQIRKLHPDRGGNTHDCATLNAVWTTLKARFLKKYGVGECL